MESGNVENEAVESGNVDTETSNLQETKTRIF